METAKLVSMRLRPTFTKLATKLAKLHGVKGRGKLFEMYMTEDLERQKAKRV